MALFIDRRDAGLQLGERLLNQGRRDVVVLGLPRGGVLVAEQVSAVLGVPLDVIVVRKLGVPYQPEVAMGAIAEGNLAVLEEATVRRARMRARDALVLVGGAGAAMGGLGGIASLLPARERQRPQRPQRPEDEARAIAAAQAKRERRAAKRRGRG